MNSSINENFLAKNLGDNYDEPPPFAPAQNRLYKEYGGRLWEDLIWITILDSVGMKDAKDTNQARCWILGKEPDHIGLYKHGLPMGGVWKFLFTTDCTPIVKWLRSVWVEVDKDPSLVSHYKKVIGKRYVSEGRKNGREI